MSDQASFFVCLFMEDGRPSGHQASTENNFAEKLPEPAQPRTKDVGEFASCFDEFVEAITGYVDFVPLILTLTPLLSHQLVVQAIQKFLERSGSVVERAPNRIVYKIPFQEASNFKRLSASLISGQTTSRHIPIALTIGLVATLEHHLSLLMKAIARTLPEAAFSKEQTIPVQDVMNYSSIDELKTAILNHEIESLMRKSFEDQIGWIEKRANIERIRDQYPSWTDLLELMERRNLFVHANGIVNEQYVRAAKQYNFTIPNELALGMALEAGPDYFRNSVRLVTDFMTKLVQVVWRKLKSDEVEVADTRISDFSYELIVRGQYTLASNILTFGVNLRNLSSERRRRIMLVNLANVERLKGNTEKALSILNAEDWSMSDKLFEICVAAVRAEIGRVVELMLEIGPAAQQPAADEYQSWPVFFHVRDDPKFTSAFKQVFGFEYVPAAKKQAGLRQVYDLLSEQKESSHIELNVPVH